jgi:nitrogen fixation NifU-like protein
MYSETVLDHFRHPRNAGEVTNATHTAEVTNPVCGDILRLTVRMDHGRIVEARFLCRGCATAIAAGSVMTERLRGITPQIASTITACEISAALGELPSATFHAAQLAESAVVAMLEAIQGNPGSSSSEQTRSDR